MNEEPIDSELDEEVARFRASRPGGVASVEPSRNLTQRVMDAVAEEALRESVRAHVTELEPSVDLTRRIMGAVAEEAARERRRARWLRAAGAAAAAVVVVLAVEMKVESGRPEVDDAGVTQTANPADEATDWLVAQQCADGTWSPAQTGGNEAFRPALTALALMALQRHAPVRHAAAIARARAALEALQTEDGAFGREPSSKLYNHSFAAFALLSLEDGQDGELSPTIQRAIAFSLRSQNHLGSWDYPPREDGNAALTVWQLGILMKARKAGWSDDGGQLRRGLAWLRRQGNGGFFDYREDFDRHYTPRSGNVTLTAMATSTLLEAAEVFPELHETAENAVASLHLACERLAARAADGHRSGDLYATVVALLSAQQS